MLRWSLALLIGGTLALWQYRGSGRRHLRLRLLRVVAGSAIALWLFDAPLGRAGPVRPEVALDVSASWLVADEEATWERARRLADSLAADPSGVVLLFGDSVRPSKPPTRPTDLSSRIRPVVERAMASGRPIHLISDGRVEDAEWVSRLPVGSVVHRIDPPSRTQAMLVGLEVPSAAQVGDTVEVRVGVVADAQGAPPSRLRLLVGGRVVETIGLEGLDVFASRTLPIRVPVGDRAGDLALRAELEAGGRPIDSVATSLRIEVTPRLVMLSTAPDQDARYALATLRRVQTRRVQAFWQVAPGRWLVDGAMTPIAEAEVRSLARGAQLLLLHGDTTFLDAAARRAVPGLLLWGTASAGDQAYPVVPDPSPLAGLLAGVPWDSLPPIDVVPMPRGTGQPVVMTRRARRTDPRPAIVVREEGETGRRVATVAAAGFWRWQLRGGRSAEAYEAIFGSLFDWVGRGGAAMPPEGSPTDGAPGTVTSRQERLPRTATLQSGPVGEGAPVGVARGARGRWWVLGLALAALALEWVLRRQRGLR